MLSVLASLQLGAFVLFAAIGTLNSLNRQQMPIEIQMAPRPIR